MQEGPLVTRNHGRRDGEWWCTEAALVRGQRTVLGSSNTGGQRGCGLRAGGEDLVSEPKGGAQAVLGQWALLLLGFQGEEYGHIRS